MRTLPSPSRPFVALASAAALAASVGCGDPYYGSDLSLVIEDPPPPILVQERYELTTPSIDALDGFVTLDGRVEAHDGLEVTAGGSVAFLSFDVSAIPYGAWVTWAELVLVDVGYASYGGPVELAIASVDYGDRLDASAQTRPFFDPLSFVLGGSAAGSAVGLDLTPLVRYEIDYGGSRIGLRLDAFGGDLLFEDGGSHLGTGTVPLLSVAYEW